MQQKRYITVFKENFLVAEFVSEGKNGAIRKVVAFQTMPVPNLYNLAFGDKYSYSNDFNDTSISDNGDTETVLATVAFIVRIFLEQYPAAWVLAQGSSLSRNRLYQIGISKHFTEISKDYKLLGMKTDDDWENFQKGKNYIGFAIRLKI